MQNIAQNIEALRVRVAEAAGAAGRRPEDINIVAASKTNSADRVREAVRAGITDVGENRVQELIEKNTQDAYEGARLHFIGHLQKNKAHNVVGTAGLIQSADSIELIKLIGSIAAKKGIVQDILIEVNIGGELSKSGIGKEKIPEVLDTCSATGGVFVRGLMAIPPDIRVIGDNRRFFYEMYKLFVDITPNKYDNISMEILSMGMTSDFEAAIAEGSNMIRIGSAIFGQRG